MADPYGAFHIKHDAFATEVAPHRNLTVADDAGKFAMPLTPRYCCVVVPPKYKGGKRHLCGSIRQNNGIGDRVTCGAHKKLNDEAKAWMDGRGK